MQDKELHALLLRAVAGESCSRQVGEIRDITVVVEAADEADAHERVLWALARRGWISAELRRHTIADDDPTLDPALRQAVIAARRHGEHVLVYEP
ncbi:MAG TPA: hypothetical protein VGF42_01515 [Caulobacteraceae bacterium]|jgi:hypothetical protein